MNINGTKISLADFYQAMESTVSLKVSASVQQLLEQAHQHVRLLANSDKAIYGLNTGLGANLGYRVKPEDIADFQYQIIAGRTVACGEHLPELIGRGILLSRIISAAKGHSGLSPTSFSHLCKVYSAGLSPAIPGFGSIGVSDLTQNAHAAAALFGEGLVFQNGLQLDAAQALEQAEISPVKLQPKDGLALINHSGLTVSLAAQALFRTSRAINAMKHAIVLSYAGYEANQEVLSEKANQLRESPGQLSAASWFRDALSDTVYTPRQIQEALSFRTIAPVVGACEHALQHAVAVWEAELNGAPDSPAILDDGSMLSTSNFHTPAIALALQNLSTSLVILANGSAQRMQRLMNPELSELPRYLSPLQNASAGFVPSQKTALALLADIAQGAMPVMLTPLPVSDNVEDVATMTPQTAQKLNAQMNAFELLAGLESLVACQAIDLRKKVQLGEIPKRAYESIRSVTPMLEGDRALGTDINKAAAALLSV